MRYIGRRRLLGGPTLEPFAAGWAVSAGSVVALHHGLGGNNVFHDPLMPFHVIELRIAVGAADRAGAVVGNGHLDVLVDLLGDGPMGRLMSRFPPRPLSAL